MEKYEAKQAINHAIGKFGVKCADCGKDWLLGDFERTEEQKKEWLCPNCISRIRAEEAKVDSLEEELTDMFGEGGKEEVKEYYGEPTPEQENKYDALKEQGDEGYDSGREMELIESPKDEPEFYTE